MFQSHHPRQRKCPWLWGGHGRGHEWADQELKEEIKGYRLNHNANCREVSHEGTSSDRQRNLKKVTYTGVGAGDKEESLVKLSRVEFDQNFLLFNIESVRFPPRSPVAVFLLPPPENLKFAVVPEACFLLHTVEPVSGQEFLSRVPFPITEFNFIHKVMAA